MADMAHCGRRDRAGRPKGATNRRTEEAIKKAAETGELPHEFLLRVMRGDEIDGERATLKVRMEAAVAAAPYYAAKKIAGAEVADDESAERYVLSYEPMTGEEWLAEFGRQV